MNINMRKMVRYFTMLLIGFSLLFYGVIELVITDHSTDQPTDAEIIERARELGMVGLNELYLKDLEESE